MDIVTTSFKSPSDTIKSSSPYTKGEDPLFTSTTFLHGMSKREEMSLGLKFRHVSGNVTISLNDGNQKLAIYINTARRLTVSSAFAPNFYMEMNLVDKGLDIVFHVRGGIYKAYINGCLVSKNTTTPSTTVPTITVAGGTNYINSLYVKEGPPQLNWKVTPAQYSLDNREVSEYTLLHRKASGSIVVRRNVEFDHEGFTLLYNEGEDVLDRVVDVPYFTRFDTEPKVHGIGTVFKLWKNTPDRNPTPLTYRVI